MGKPAPLYVVALLSLLAMPANFLPYGHGDTVNPISDDGSSGAISLQQPFKYFGRTHSRLFVNNNGFITFTEQMFSYVPFLNSRRDIIAPMWTDLDNRRGGTISYREDTSSAVLVQVTAAVKQYFPNIPFTATSAFVATWDSVPYYSGGGEATFQVVLVSSVHRSFILFNYGVIAATRQIWLAGYYTMDSVNSFTIPAAGVPELSSSSNINENGRWSFRVDGSPNLPTMFLPFGDREVLNPPSEDGSSDVIYLQQTFKYFGRSYNQIFVNNNGYLTFTEPLSAYDPSLVSARDIIAPLWTRLDNRQGGTISYREDTRSAVLAQVTAAVKQYFPNIPFAATTAFVATWDSVPYHNGGGAGYSTMDSVSSFTVPAAGVPELSSGSNINVNGCWSFSVDGSSNLPVNFLPFGNEETVTPRLEDGSSEAITLQRPLKFFRRTHHQIFVNNNGYLTFTEPLSAYVPILNSGRDIIAPLWTRLDNRQGGTISYREDTSSAVLAQVTAAVQQYFPNIPFAATSAFVATWDSVPYYSGGGVATFQVVLVSSVHRSFILINYGDIAETEQIWQVSEDSNINVNGRWSFHVDGSPNLPANLLPFGNGETLIRTSDAGNSEAILLQQPVTFFGRTYTQIFVNINGHLTFTEPLNSYIPLLNSGRDIIAPLWTHLDNRRGGTISYREDTSSAVLAQVTAAVNQYFPNLPLPFAATSTFVATWDSVPYSSGEGEVTFQVVLVSSVDHSFTLFTYGNIAETTQLWLAHYDTEDAVHSYTISLTTVSELSSSSNVNVNGRWVFHVYSVCDTLGCTGNEVCRFRDAYGCGCLEGQRPNPKTFDAIEFCASSTGTMSLSRCQLFESDVPFETLHLNDPSCSGTLENDRVLFHFDNEGHVCGTTLTSNSTHFIYQNSIQSNLPAGVITRERWMNIAFSCAYPLIQTLSMPMGIKAEQGVVSIDLPGQGTYHIRMIPYNDAQFTSPYEGNVEVQVNQQIYVAVEVEGVDRSQIAAVLDNCWATPVNDSDFQIRWNLIVRECPNPEDGTVEVLQNGIDTTSRFSFRMFTFTRASDRIFLHCQSCHPGNRRRRRRSLDSYHSAAITMGF
ncbi:Alpha-tectorin [Labeo rohita]|uniref:Alpha-tectorin n=1 Tax=Labeo rohita TaxID=84645 RepID=A0ABQ8LH81_LABRO|nr:Alpha-tectorin [Labeo rohita]